MTQVRQEQDHCPRCGRPLPSATAGGAIGQVPRAPQELCSWCLTGHGPTWTDLGTLRNTRWTRFNLRLRRRMSQWFGDEVTYKLDPPESDVDTK